MQQSKGEDTTLYRRSAVLQPSIEELAQISNDLGLKCSQTEIADIQEYFKGTVKDYQRLDELVPPQPESKYPRTVGHRNTSDNAWYWRCEVKGAADGLLHGKTVGIKDNIPVAGVPMMAGSRLLEGYIPDRDAPVVTRILDAGGTIVGKTSCEDLCLGVNSFLCATGPVENPFDKTRSSGGSSSGSASLVARGKVDIALGTCQAGSIRVPCSWCGVVGLKPTYGLVPYTDAIPLEYTIDHIGPIARTVSDCALMLEAIAGYDGGTDPRQRDGYTPPKYSQLLEKDLRGMKIGLLDEGFECCDEEVSKCVKNAAEKLIAVGANVEGVSVPLHREGCAINAPINLEGKYNMMVRCNGFGRNQKGRYNLPLQEALTRGFNLRPFDTSITFKMACLWGEYTQRNYQGKFYSKAQNLNMLLTQEYDRILQTYDVIVMPTTPTKPLILPTVSHSPLDLLKLSTSAMKNTAPFNMTGHPALTINAGFLDGLPVGMMIVGSHYNDLVVLQVAQALETLQDRNTLQNGGNNEEC